MARPPLIDRGGLQNRSGIFITSQNPQHWSFPSPTPSTCPVQQEDLCYTHWHPEEHPRNTGEPSCWVHIASHPSMWCNQAESDGDLALPWGTGGGASLGSSPAGGGSSWLEATGHHTCTSLLEGLNPTCSLFSAGKNAEKYVRQKCTEVCKAFPLGKELGGVRGEVFSSRCPSSQIPP